MNDYSEISIEHEWGCDFDRSQQYGEPVNPERCTCDPVEMLDRLRMSAGGAAAWKLDHARDALYASGAADRDRIMIADLRAWARDHPRTRPVNCRCTLIPAAAGRTPAPQKGTP